MGNRELVEYGIQTEASDFRIHVGFKVGKIYVFPTANGIKAIEEHEYEATPAYQPGYDFPTGMGYRVPWTDIEGCREIDIPPDLWMAVSCQESESTSVKGRKAQRVVAEMLKRGLIPLPFLPSVVTDKDLQISGLDLRVGGVDIQAKCDFGAGQWELGGTGNLYLQIAECNPSGAY